MTTGVETRRGSAFISARVSRPFFRGMFTSIKTRAARIPGRRRRWSSAMPSGSHTGACPLPARFQASSSSRKSGGLSSATSTGQLVLTFIRYGFSHWYLSTRVGRPVAPVFQDGGADPLVRSRRPRRLAAVCMKLISLATSGSRGTRADQGGPPHNLGFRWAEREEKGSAHARFGFGPDAPAVPGDDAFDGGDADARAFKFCLGVQPLEHVEDAFGIFGGEAGAVVAHRDDGRGVATGGGKDLDAGGVAAAGKLQGVGEQVDQHDAEQGGVGIEPGQGGNRPLDGSSPG